MSVLDTLKFIKQVPASIKAKKEGKSPLEKARARLVAEIDAQIALAADPEYVIRTTVKKRGGGEEQKVRKPRRWVVIEEDTAYITVRSSNKIINLGGKKGHVIECASNEVTRTLRVIREWAVLPEADRVLEKAMKSAVRGKRVKRTKFRAESETQPAEA